ncbi:MAG: shikimate kinase [Pyrinomonadaceae bacterium]
MNRPIVIVGFMGAGKTTVARELARQLGCAMVDLDELVVLRSGHYVAEIIDMEGEERFRQIESAALRQTIEEDREGVIALGGGTWTIPANREAIRAAAMLTVWLDTPFEICWERIRTSSDERPLARSETEARALFASRRVDYVLADIRIGDEAVSSLESTVAAIMNLRLEPLEK